MKRFLKIYLAVPLLLLAACSRPAPIQLPDATTVAGNAAPKALVPKDSLFPNGSNTKTALGFLRNDSRLNSIVLDPEAATVLSLKALTGRELPTSLEMTYPIQGLGGALCLG
jgi:predicted small lipoprotein YifL